MDINFDCTMCGGCCHDLKIPLTVAEAIAWLSDGNVVQILTEAVPWPDGSDKADEADVQIRHKHARSFPVMSGALPTRVVVILAGSFSGPCPNLGPAMACGIYHRRPLTCRIYPAEISSHIVFDHASKKCPPDAWDGSRPPFFRQGQIVDAGIQHAISQAGIFAVEDVAAKEWLCVALGVDTAALVNEGYVIYTPGRTALLQALEAAVGAATTQATVPQWRYATNRQTTLDVLASVRALCLRVGGSDSMPFEYLGFRAAN